MSNVEIDGEIDASFSSYWDPEKHGQMNKTIGGTTEDDKHDELTEILPSDIDPADLTDKQKTVLEEAVSNPFQTAGDIDDTIGSTQYANKILKDKAPEFYENVFKPRGNSRGGRKKGTQDENTDSETNMSDTTDKTEHDSDDLETVLEAIKATAQEQETIDALNHLEKYL